MGRRFITSRLEKANISFSQMWPSAGMGRYWKRMLSKARRRAWKQDGIEGKLDNAYERTCSWKDW